MAEAAFRDTVEKLGYAGRFSRIDSCGTSGYHVGNGPDHRIYALSFLFSGKRVASC